MSKPNKSKAMYQGNKIRRLPRSELEDNTMRDLNRFDNRLDHNLRTVDRARDVMLKSLESDKQIFIRGGVRSNKMYSMKMQNPGDTRQRRDVTSQPGKYQPDTRNRKLSHTQETPLPAEQSLNGSDVINNNTTTTGNNTSSNSATSSSSTSAGSKHATNHLSQGQINNNLKYRDILTETQEVINKQSAGDELVDEFLSNYNRNSNNNSRRGSGDEQTTTTHAQTSSKSSTTDRQSNRINQTTNNESGSGVGVKSKANGANTGSNSNGYRSSTTPTIKTEEYYGGPIMYLDPSQPKTGPVDAMYIPYEEFNNYGRRPHFWDYLSTPKNPSRNLQKREQLEREFSSPALKPRATTPAAKSAKGPRTITGTSSAAVTGSSLLGVGLSSPRVKSASQKKSSPTPSLKVKAKSPSSRGK